MPVRRKSVSRRQFFRTTVQTGALVVAPQIIPASALGKDGAVPPSDRIVLGAIGIGGRGRLVLSSFMAEPEVQFVAICDIRAERREAVKQIADEKYGNKDCSRYRDMHEILARSDIDAVLIAIGDRWHTAASVLAARAGKDIFCEKPCSMTIAESRALADTIARFGRIYQAGTQRRNVPNFIHAIDLVHSGKLGKLHTVHANTQDPKVTHAWLPAQPEPPKDVVDWDLWLGPCPWRPFNPDYVRGRWRNFFDFHGGGILEWGSHTVDLCQWANKADDTAPVEYEPQGNHVICHYANGVKLVMRDTGWPKELGTCCVRFEGDTGWVETGDFARMNLSDNLSSEHRTFTERGTNPAGHVRDFLNCVKSRSTPRSNAKATGQSHIACHAAYIAWQLGRKVRFDPAKDEFLGDAEANRMRSRAIREPWRI
jgi:predicted dehydrogenase